MERSAGEDEIADNGGASTLAKRKRPAIDGGASSAAGGVCDDTVGSILARLPARTAIACMVLSKRHRSLIRGPEFRSLHCRLGAPLPSPHIAYLATAPIHRRPEHHRYASGYYGFHLAGAAGLTGSSDAPIRSVAGWRYLGTKHVNTCNGVLLLATSVFSDQQCRCTLWNPAIADVAREETVPKPSPEKKTSEPIVLPDGTELRYKRTQFLALGLGYGRRSNTYKLLVCRKDRFRIHRLIHHHGATHHFEYSLLVHSLGGDNNKETQLRNVYSMGTVLSCTGEVDKEIIQNKSLYVDGKIYFLHLKKYEINEILAFDVDDETVRTIDMLDERHEANFAQCWDLELIEMSGRPCLVITKRDCIALWHLTANYKMEPIHVISYKKVSDLHDHKIAGVWNCSGILFLWFNCQWKDQLLLYDVTAKKIFRAGLPHDLATVNKFDYMLCWGYKPTLVSPRSIIGELSQDMKRRRGHSAHITEVIDPLVLQDRRKGQKATLNTVCLMKFLVRIMQKLPHDLQEVVEMPSMDSEGPYLLFQNVV